MGGATVAASSEGAACRTGAVRPFKQSEVRVPGDRQRKAKQDIVERLRRSNAGREPERLTLKYRAMRASPFAFFRGTADLFWEDLHATPRATPDAPPVWACGDLHLENFGCYRGDNDLAYFDLNDFDESALAPLTWEVARFVTGILVAAPTLALDAAAATELVNIFFRAYRHALIDGTARWIERATATGMVRALFRQVKTRPRTMLLEARTVEEGDERRLRADRRRALPVTASQRKQITDGLGAFGESQPDPAFYTVLDVARRIAGKASLGLQRYIVLVRGDGSPKGNVLLDLKEARPSSLARAAPTSQPVWPSEPTRIVTTQRRMQARAPALLHAVKIERTGFVMRELQPTEDRLRLKDAVGHPRRLRRVMEAMGHLTAWAELRSSGRQGSASIDALSTFACTGGWRQALVSHGRAYARQVERDYQRFVVAHEDDVIH
jgi:uncharacterized protein (DUF2252 family)